MQRLEGLAQHVRSCIVRFLFFFFLASPECTLSLHRLRHDSKDGVVAADAWPDLLVVFLGVAHLVELGLQKQHTNVTKQT